MVPLSLLDLALVGEGETVGDSLAGCVTLAQRAEQLGYHRVWYAEHHNMASIASAATSVLIAHVAAHTTTIRLGAGGVMLPNHSPLTVAEQFGTLAELHPGRIDLGLGRAPGTDQRTLRALRRDARAAERFPTDVRELQAFLGDTSPIPGVTATPGAGTHVPLYILGSSTFGAGLAAALGLPYAFASHFAPDALEVAVARYRAEFQPSAQLDRPYVIAGVNVIASPTTAEANEEFERTVRRRVRLFYGRERPLSDDEVELLMDSPAGEQVRGMLRYHAVGRATEVAAGLADFAEHADADELIVASAAVDRRRALQTIEALAGAFGLSGAA
ncbi:MAG: LLM class flavin-dependent oxidoreductase [Nitriliruptoraceae bacterium]